MVITRVWRAGRRGEVGQAYQLPVRRWVSSGNVMCSIVIIVDNILYIYELLREYNFKVLATKKW